MNLDGKLLDTFLVDPVSAVYAAAKKKGGEVTLRELTKDQRTSMSEAKDAEVQSWMRYHAVEAALRSDFDPSEVMRLRWVLSFKADGKAKARLVVIGYQDPRLEQGIVKAAPVISRRGRQMFLTAAAHKGWFINKGDVKAAFLQGDVSEEPAGVKEEKAQGEHDESAKHLVCEPVPELAQALGLEHWQIVRLVKSAYGLVDAPRMWWRRLTTDLQGLGWKPCACEPCLLRLFNKEGDLIGLICFHVDDVLVAGAGAQFEQNFEQIQNLYEWGSWESRDFVQCGTRMRQNDSAEIFVDQAAYVLNIEPMVVDKRWREDPDMELDAKAKTQLRAKIGELQWFATQTGLQILASLSLAQPGGEPCGKDLLEVNKVVRQAHAVAHDGIRIPCLRTVGFACWADASWANRRDLGSTCGYVVAAVEKQFFQNGVSPTAVVSWYSKKCQRVARSSGAAEIQAASEGQEELEYCRLLWAEMFNVNFTVREASKWVPTVLGTLLVDAKGIYDALARSESAALSMKDKRSAIEGIALKAALVETRTAIRWCHSGVNVADALTKAGNGPLELLRSFLKADAWQIPFDPTFTSFRKLKARAREEE